MGNTEKQVFTKFEVARIIGARALQIAMDAPLLLKISDEKLKEIKYDSIKIAELEFKENVLPIAISRPTPKKRKDKLGVVKEEHVSDEELIEKEKEVEKEIVADATTLGLVTGDEAEDDSSESPSSSGKAEEQ